jgi:hypothetical protein
LSRILWECETAFLRQPIWVVNRTAADSSDGQNDVVYGMARMYSILAENAGVQCRSVSRMFSANVWLQQFDNGSQ